MTQVSVLACGFEFEESASFQEIRRNETCNSRGERDEVVIAGNLNQTHIMNTTLEKDRSEGAKMGAGAFDGAMWRDRFPSEPYAVDSDLFEDYEPAYRFGSELKGEVKDFDIHEMDLRERWDSVKGESRLNWDRARDAVRAAWEDEG